MSHYTSKTIQSRRITTSKRVGLIFVGLLLGYLIGFAIQKIFIYPLELHKTSEWIINSGVYTFTVGYVFLGGYKWIKHSHVGVPSLFGERLQNLVFTEGWTWLPPSPIMDMDILSVEVDIKDVTAASIVTTDLQRLSLTGTIIYRIEDPYIYLNNSKEVKSILLQRLMESSFRGQTITDNLSNTNLLTVNSEFGNSIREGARQISLEYGIDIKNIFLIHISGSQQLMQIYENLYIRLQTKFMDITEKKLDYSFYYEVFNDIVKNEFIRNNFSGKDIATFLLLYMGKVERKEYNFGINANENILKAIKDLLEYYKSN